MSICAVEVKFIRDTTGYRIDICKAMAYLLKDKGYNVYSDVAIKKMMEMGFYEKAERYVQYKTIQTLIYEFGPFKNEV